MARFHCLPNRSSDRSFTDAPGAPVLVTDAPPSADALRRALRALRLELAAPVAPADPAEPPQGPGWFDSSWELDRGLEVREDAPGDAALHGQWMQLWADAAGDRSRPRPSARGGSAGGSETPDRFAGFDIAGLALA